MASLDVIENVPCWMTDYLMNGEQHGLDDNDWKCIDELSAYLDRSNLRLVAPIAGTYNEFCSAPAFGLACSVEDWRVESIA